MSLARLFRDDQGASYASMMEVVSRRDAEDQENCPFSTLAGLLEK